MLGGNDGQASSNGTSGAASNGSRTQQRTSLAASANGTHKVAVSRSVNGSSQNGKEAARQQTRSYFGHDREEVTRILIQALSDMGYAEAAESVSRTSGFALESQTVTRFRNAVLDGDWAEAERLLLDAALPEDEVQPDSGLVLAAGADKNLMKFWLRQQKFLELLEQRDTGRALSVLRNELTPLYQDTPKVQFLASLLMCQSADDLKAKAEWDGAYGQSRAFLLSALAKSISPSVMLPEHRLAVLLEQVKEHQIETCLFHSSAGSPSLYSDHYCVKSNFPTEVLYELSDHAGEVWQIKFSHDGKRLASCGGDQHVIIWDVPSFKVVARLDTLENGVGNIAWSPDDTMLVTCGRDCYARIWDMATGRELKVFERFDEPVSSCAWAVDGQSIILGSFDKERSLCQWSLRGEKLFTFTKKHRTEDAVLSPDGHWLVAMDDGGRVHVYDAIAREFVYEMELEARPTSVSISQNSQFLLVNKQDGEWHLYDIAARGQPVHKYVGAAGGGRFVIRGSFGGAHESFVISGSEDGKVVIWHKANSTPLFKLDAHKPRCNAVCWNPTDPCMFASCGDDNKVKIWSNAERVRQKELEAPHQASGGKISSNGWRPDLPDA